MTCVHPKRGISPGDLVGEVCALHLRGHTSTLPPPRSSFVSKNGVKYSFSSENRHTIRAFLRPENDLMYNK